MAKDTAPAPMYLWKVRYLIGHSQSTEDMCLLAARSIEQLMERWEQRVSKNLKYTILPTIIAVLRQERRIYA